ncbi:hypothetical protein BgiMline_021002 [Biomphalaria glabrata]|nr:hypothetical protein BgiMline_018166 [Biomphalaria glabrata]
MSQENLGRIIGLYDIIGGHEMQIADDGEGDVATDIKTCTKNPGHEKFIPVNNFRIEHLPEEHRDLELFKYIKSVSVLTVRVDVQNTSPRRPDVWPGTRSVYPCYSMAGRESVRRGSGRISLVTKYAYGYDQEGGRHWLGRASCACHVCQLSSSPRNSWWEIEVLTATHVVFDEVEASQASCRLFYDSPDSPVTTLDVVGVGFVNVERDWCRLVCTTCDNDLGEVLFRLKKCCNVLWKTVHERYRVSRDVDKLMFMVSHPHGGPKQVSLGQWQDRYLVDSDIHNYNKFTYTTSTCPGSSGATVYCLGYTGWWLYQLVHSGTLPSGLNYSGSAFVL